MRCAERDQSVHVAVAPHALHVITSDQAPKAVPNDVDPLVARGHRELFDGFAQACGGLRDVVGQQAVVVGGEPLEATTTERAFHHGKDCVVVDDPVYEQDRRLGRVYAVMEESTLLGIEASKIVPPPVGGASR